MHIQLVIIYLGDATNRKSRSNGHDYCH